MPCQLFYFLFFYWGVFRTLPRPVVAAEAEKKSLEREEKGCGLIDQNSLNERQMNWSMSDKIINNELVN